MWLWQQALSLRLMLHGGRAQVLAKMQSLEYISLAFNPELEVRLFQACQKPFQPCSPPLQVAAKLSRHAGVPVAVRPAVYASVACMPKK